MHITVCTCLLGNCRQTRFVTCLRTSSWVSQRSRWWCSTGARTRCSCRSLHARTPGRHRSQSPSTSCATSVTDCSTSNLRRTACAPRTRLVYLRAPLRLRLPRRTWASSSTRAVPFASPSRSSIPCSTLDTSTSTCGSLIISFIMCL